MKLRLVLGLLACVQAVFGAAISPELTRVIADKYLAKEPAPVLEKGFSMEEGLRAQAAFVELLKPKLGSVAGYKVGLITKAGQERMGASGPVHGVLLKKMLHSDQSEISAHYGTRPALELDMGVMVKDDGINSARTAEEAVEHLSYLTCFIELVDTITATNQTMDGALLTALNVGARGGVLGDRVKMAASVAKGLPTMRMFLTDELGKVLADVPKLGLQPLDNLPWLVRELKKAGTPLKKGDFISLGSPAPTQPVVAGKKVTLHYGITGVKELTCSVKFSE